MRQRWDEIALRAKAFPAPHNGCEVGVLHGKCSANLLQIMPQLRLTMVDLWRGLTEDERVGVAVDLKATWADDVGMAFALESALRCTEFAQQRREIVQGDMFKWADECRALGIRFSWVFLDADHTEGPTRAAIDAYWPLVEPGGFLSGHDYGHPQMTWGVRAAVDAWAEEQKLLVELGDDLTWFVWKPKETQE